MFWVDLTEQEKGQVFGNGLTLSEEGGTRPIKKNQGGPADYDAILSKSRAEARDWRLTDQQYQQVLADNGTHNCLGVVPASPIRTANRLLSHHAAVTFDVSAELAELYELTPDQHFRLWTLAWKEMLAVILEHRHHPDSRVNEFMLEDALLETLYDRVPGLFKDDDIVSLLTDDPQEQEILRGKLAGKTSREIAELCHVGKSTVNRRLMEINARFN